MHEKEKNILDAAMRLFSRYGVKRTSMGDLANEAGISRQTLYNAFSNKDEILRAHIQLYTENAIAEVETGLEATNGLSAQLDLVFDKMVVVGFDMVRATPNAEDIVEGFDASSRKELERASKSFSAVIEKILSSHETVLTRSGLSATDLADFVQRSASAAKRYASDREHLLRQLETLKHLCLAAAGVTK